MTRAVKHFQRSSRFSYLEMIVETCCPSEQKEQPPGSDRDQDRLRLSLLYSERRVPVKGGLRWCDSQREKRMVIRNRWQGHLVQ